MTAGSPLALLHPPRLSGDHRPLSPRERVGVRARHRGICDLCSTARPTSAPRGRTKVKLALGSQTALTPALSHGERGKTACSLSVGVSGVPPLPLGEGWGEGRAPANL